MIRSSSGFSREVGAALSRVCARPVGSLVSPCSVGTDCWIFAPRAPAELLWGDVGSTGGRREGWIRAARGARCPKKPSTWRSASRRGTPASGPAPHSDHHFDQNLPRAIPAVAGPESLQYFAGALEAEALSALVFARFRCRRWRIRPPAVAPPGRARNVRCSVGLYSFHCVCFELRRSTEGVLTRVVRRYGAPDHVGRRIGAC